jgi:acyl transferase
MERMLDWLATERNTTSMGVVATSLSARIAYRVISLRPALRYLVTAVGVTHLQDTLHRVFGVDHIARPIDELPPTVFFEDKYEITTRPFATDAHEHRWSAGATTRAELERVHVPIAAFVARNDDWVLEREVEEALDLAHRPERKMYKLEGSGHNLNHNPRIAQAMLCEMTRSVMALAGGHAELPTLAREPTFEEITEHLIYERRRS